MLVIGQAKVISYEDLNKARVARAAKDKAAAVKGTSKRGRKRKASAHDAEEEEEEEAEVVEVEVSSREVVSRQAGSSVPRVKTAKRKSTVHKPAPWTAPVALMYTVLSETGLPSNRVATYVWPYGRQGMTPHLPEPV